MILICTAFKEIKADPEVKSEMGIHVCIGFTPPGITKVIGKVPADRKVARSGPTAHIVV